MEESFWRIQWERARLSLISKGDLKLVAGWEDNIRQDQSDEGITDDIDVPRMNEGLLMSRKQV